MTSVDILHRLEEISYQLSRTRTGPINDILSAATRADDAVIALIHGIEASLDDQAPKVADLDEQDQISLDAARWDEMHEPA